MPYKPSYEKWSSRSERTLKQKPSLAAEEFQYRYQELRASGMLPFERFWLVTTDINTTSMQMIMEDRRRMLWEAKESGLSYWGYYRQIKDMYDRNRWYFRGGGKNPYELIDHYKKQFNIEDTPEGKRKKKIKGSRDFAASRRVSERK